MILKQIAYVALGVYTGAAIVLGDLANYERIEKMLALEESHIFLVFLSAIVTGMLGVWLIKKFKPKTILDNETIEIPKRTFSWGLVFGGVVFGIGWALTGTCPGPIYVQIGGGVWPTLFTLIGGIVGAYIYSYFKEKLPH